MVVVLTGCSTFLDSNKHRAGLEKDMAKVQLTHQEQLHVNNLMERLSSDELAVLKLVADGEINKTIAKTLGIAVRTVESRRARIVDKLEVLTFPELLQIWLAYKGEFHLRGFQAVTVVE